MNTNQIKKMWPVIKKNRFLRILSLLNISFVVLVIILLSVYVSFNQETEAYQEELQKNEQTILNLQKLAITNEEEEDLDIELFENKSFADYEDVIPFIAFLENLFESTDPEAEITIKSREDQIVMDHFADYKMDIKINDKKAFFQALDKLHESRFITKLISFTMFYKDDEGNSSEDTINELSSVEMTLRLFLN